jgi:hypothetical protein
MGRDIMGSKKTSSIETPALVSVSPFVWKWKHISTDIQERRRREVTSLIDWSFLIFPLGLSHAFYQSLTVQELLIDFESNYKLTDTFCSFGLRADLFDQLIGVLIFPSSWYLSFHCSAYDCSLYRTAQIVYDFWPLRNIGHQNRPLGDTVSTKNGNGFPSWISVGGSCENVSNFYMFMTYSNIVIWLKFWRLVWIIQFWDDLTLSAGKI